MAEKEQELFWISAKSCFGHGKNSLKNGDPIGDKIPKALIPHFKKTGEVGAMTASAKNVSTDAAYSELEKKLKEVEDNLAAYELAVENVVKLLNQDSIKKDEKSAMIETLEDLNDET